MRALLMGAVGLAACLCAAEAIAGDAPQWASYVTAEKNAVASAKPIFVYAGYVVPGEEPDPQYTQLRNAAANDEQGKLDAACFELAFVSTVSGFYSPQPKSDYTNKEVVAQFGANGTASVFVPGATRPLWRGQIQTACSTLREAKQAYDAWKTELDNLKKTTGQDDGKDDPLAHLALAEAWAKAHKGAEASGAMEKAIKLMKKANKDDPAIETATLRRADMLLDAMMWKEAEAAFVSFQKSFRASASYYNAKLGQLRAVGYGGNAAAAKQLGQALLDDKKAGVIHGDVSSHLDALKDPVKCKGYNPLE